jgi:hypothetical protein
MATNGHEQPPDIEANIFSYVMMFLLFISMAYRVRDQCLRLLRRRLRRRADLDHRVGLFD